MVLIGAHTFAWSPGITDAELTPLFAAVAGTAIDYVELATYDLEGLSPSAIVHTSAKYGLPVTLCSGLPGGLSLATADAGVRRQAQDHVRRLLDFAHACGALKLSGPIHGDLSKPPTDPSSHDDHQRLLDSYGELRPELAAAGIPFSIEPLNRYQSSLLNTLQQVDALASSLQLDHVGILADLFHANFEQDHLYDDLETLQPRITHVHLCGANRGAIGRCHLDWDRLTRWIATFPGSMMMSVETFDSQHPVTSRRTRTWRALGGTAQAIVLEGAAEIKRRLRDLPQGDCTP
jgi:D-psicose/D-tagatose/L-ribulose 3-epimerase